MKQRNLIERIRAKTNLIFIDEENCSVLTKKGYPKELNSLLLELAIKYGFYIETFKK